MRRMHRLAVVVAAIGILGAAGAGSAFDEKEKDAGKRWHFDDAKAGGLPDGFRGEVGEWKVVAEEKAPSGKQALEQSAKNERPVFNLALIDGTSYRDVDISVKLKSVSGEIDQGGGVVWRAKDAKNYYIARYNPLETNFRVYKVEDGQRSRQFQSADVEAPEGWVTLRVVMQGDHITCYLDGKKHLDVKDATFKEAGKIGLWTKADARTRFDDLTVSKSP